MIIKNSAFSFHILIKIHFKEFESSLFPDPISRLPDAKRHKNPTLSFLYIPSIWYKTVNYWNVCTLIEASHVPDVIFTYSSAYISSPAFPYLEHSFKASCSTLGRYIYSLQQGRNKALCKIFRDLGSLHWHLGEPSYKEIFC